MPGYDLVEAADGEKALAAFARQTPATPAWQIKLEVCELDHTG
jgi:hypothetical protein